MKTLSLLAVVLALGLSLATGDADAAKRLGGGKSAGMQRQMTTQTAPGATPAQAPMAPTAATAPAYGAAAAAAPAAAAQSKRSWMGPLAGIAAGLGLAALASHFGFGEQLASMMMIGLVVMAVVLVVGMIMRRRAAAQQPALAHASGMAYRDAQPAAETPRGYDVAMPPAAAATPGAATGSSLFNSAMGGGLASGSGSGSAIGSAIGAGLTPAAAPAAPRTLPADFDVATFVRSAKVNFIRLQAANDSGNLDDIREFTTSEMFAELKMDLVERGAATQQTDVVSVEAQVVEVVEEATRYIASVRFSGLIREDKGAAAEPFDEIWHLVKPRAGTGGWLLSGIQQMQ